MLGLQNTAEEHIRIIIRITPGHVVNYVYAVYILMYKWAEFHKVFIGCVMCEQSYKLYGLYCSSGGNIFERWHFRLAFSLRLPFYFTVGKTRYCQFGMPTQDCSVLYCE